MGISVDFESMAIDKYCSLFCREKSTQLLSWNRCNCDGTTPIYFEVHAKFTHVTPQKTNFSFPINSFSFNLFFLLVFFLILFFLDFFSF